MCPRDVQCWAQHARRTHTPRATRVHLPAGRRHVSYSTGVLWTPATGAGVSGSGNVACAAAVAAACLSVKRNTHGRVVTTTSHQPSTEQQLQAQQWRCNRGLRGWQRTTDNARVSIRQRSLENGSASRDQYYRTCLWCQAVTELPQHTAPSESASKAPRSQHQVLHPRLEGRWCKTPRKTTRGQRGCS